MWPKLSGTCRGKKLKAGHKGEFWTFILQRFKPHDRGGCSRGGVPLRLIGGSQTTSMSELRNVHDHYQYLSDMWNQQVKHLLEYVAPQHAK
jgi:hypothetical protein